MNYISVKVKNFHHALKTLLVEDVGRRPSLFTPPNLPQISEDYQKILKTSRTAAKRGESGNLKAYESILSTKVDVQSLEFPEIPVLLGSGMDARLSPPPVSTPDSQWVQDTSEVFEAELRSLLKTLIADAIEAIRIKETVGSVEDKARRLEELALSYAEFVDVGKLSPYLYPISEVAALFTDVYYWTKGDGERRKHKLFVSASVLEAVDCLFTGFHTSVSHGLIA